MVDWGSVSFLGGGHSGGICPPKPVKFWEMGFASRLVLPGLAFLLVGSLLGGCAEDLPPVPEATPTNVMVAHYQSPDDFELGVIDIDGERLDREWGSEFTPERPFTHVRLSREQGGGDAGPPRYVSMKAVYTDFHIYMLVQWSDALPDVLDDVFVYVGPSLGSPIVTCAEIGGQTVCDSLFREAPQDSLLLRNWWYQGGDDDKLAIVFEMEEASGVNGLFADVGCLAACHNPSGSFDDLQEGRLDVWYWFAGRTNPIRDLFDLYDDPDDPLQGIPGWLDDMYLDAGAGLIPDEGIAPYEPNFVAGSGLPRFIYRQDDDPHHDSPDPNCTNDFNEACRSNNGVGMNYIWRNDPEMTVSSLSAEDVFNETIMPDMRMWEPGDIVAGYLLTYPRGSRGDIRGKGNYDEDAGTWTLEIARPLTTEFELQDVNFDPEAGIEYHFAVSVFDAATHDHLGSEPVVLVFGPKGD